ncbi:MAG: cyclic nucleotide-binding domain-containing protein [Desulfobacteraceae bacterium]|nr:MAG: cyclic nucleotide-binding domain-containing protein [Desulfobacteraceae bacterium]
MPKKYVTVRTGALGHSKKGDVFTMRMKAVALAAAAVGAFFLGLLELPASAAEKGKEGDLTRALADVKLIAGLSEAEREALKSAATLRRGKAGEIIIRQGKGSGKMIVIMGGKAEVRIDGKLVTTLSGQSLVGEISFLDNLPPSADVVLLEDADLIELNSAALGDLMENQPRVGYLIMREIARIEAGRLRRANP